jgi:hypothetical protein
MEHLEEMIQVPEMPALSSHEMDRVGQLWRSNFAT